MWKLYAVLISCLFVTLYAEVAQAGHANVSEAQSPLLTRRQRLTPECVEEEFKIWEQNSTKRQELEAKLSKEGKVIKRNDRKTDSSLIRNFKADPETYNYGLAQLPFDDVSDQLYRKYRLSRNEVINDLPRQQLNGPCGSQRRQNCTDTIDVATCNASARYRRIDGQCNNLQNPRWGSAGECQPRLLQPNYVGPSGFRRSANGSPLPQPRQLSLNVHYSLNRPTNYVTHMYMFFGQLLDHDITQTPQSTTIDNEAIECCPPGNETHPQCAPILVEENDPFYSLYNVTCINFVRSQICGTCTLGPRQLIDQVTSFIDASFVYGNAEIETNALRTNDSTGRLRIQETDVGDLLPPSPDPANDQCSFPETNDICFQAGDSRANQHTVLTSLHTIWVREHNRVADALRRINPQWGGNRIFEEARRIVGAEMQVITYKEYLPITLGNERMNYFNLWLGGRGVRTSYDSSQNPTMLIEFTTAAFRFGHSLINSVVANRPLNDSNQRRLLRNEFFQPFDLYNGLIGPIVSGASNSPAQWFDRHVVPDVTNFLYRIRGSPTGLDLAAININRGRDHGVPTYVEAVRYCSDEQIIVRNFDDLTRYGLMTNEQANVLQMNYRYVQDIDLWPGILSEIYNQGAVVGPTATCFIGLQFQRLKFGDRFYFEHNNQAGSFTSQQVEELKRLRLSHVICLNTNNVTQMPMNAMIFSSRNNPLIQCRSVTGINLSLWRE